jgi:hypothetical protein
VNALSGERPFCYLFTACQAAGPVGLPAVPTRPLLLGCGKVKVELTSNEKQTLVLAIGVAIQREHEALENCIREAHPNNPRAGEIDIAIRQRQRVLQELVQLRERLTQVRP